MTLVVCWKSKDKLSCVADTRISNSGATISDFGGKIFVIPVSLGKYKENVIKEKVNYSLGFAFCGSTLLANNTHVIASNCSQMLRNDSEDVFPSAEIIANMYAKVAEFVTRDTNSRLTNTTLFQGIVFGYCPHKKMYCAYLIEPNLSQDSFSVECNEINIGVGSCIVIGSGKEEFIRQINTPNSAGNQRGVFDVVSQVMDEDNVSDVGGYIQVAEATEEGVNIVPVLTQSRSDLDRVSLIVNGFEVNEFSLPEGLWIGPSAIGVGVEKIAGRSALRAKGIDPDSKKVTQALQNSASFDACLLDSYKHSKKVNVDNNFTLDKNTPIKGEWHFSAKCKKCNRSTPLFIDPSSGEMGNPFIGNGHIKTHCFRCDTAIEKKAAGLHSKKWNGT